MPSKRRIFRQDEEPKAAEMQRILRTLATKLLAEKPMLACIHCRESAVSSSLR